MYSSCTLRMHYSLIREYPTDDNFQKVATCATLIAIKEEADGKEVNEVLEQLAADTIPFFTASAN